MPRIRSIKPSAFRHEKLCDLEDQMPELRIMAVFTGLMTCADKAGRFLWQPRTLKLTVMPFVNYDLAATLAVLCEHGFLQRYEVGGKEYGCYPTWHLHQRPNKDEPESVIPAPPPPMGESPPTNNESTPDSGDSPLSKGDSPIQNGGNREKERAEYRKCGRQFGAGGSSKTY